MRRQIKPFTVERKRNGRVVAPNEPPGLTEAASPPVETAPPAPPRWAAAEALFAAREEPTAPDGGDAPQPSGGRILPSLLDVAPETEAAPDPARKRQRRKPNAPSDPKSGRSAPGAAQGPPSLENAMRNLFDFWQQEEDAPERVPADAERPSPFVLRRRGRVERAALPRGQRWKARLPRFAR